MGDARDLAAGTCAAPTSYGSPTVATQQAKFFQGDAQNADVLQYLGQLNSTGSPPNLELTSATNYQAGSAFDPIPVGAVGITASFSILDHMDGLCAGIAAMASIFFAMLAYLNGQTLVTTLAAAVLGAATGFLRWNFKPAKIFMGDGGAMFLGFLMATLGLKLRLEQANHLSGWLAPLLILGVTIFDTTLVTISRSRRGLLPFTTPGKDHAAHRLANLGLGQRGAVLALYSLGALTGGTAVLVAYLPSTGTLGVAILAGALLLLAVAWLERAPYEPQGRKPAQSV